MPLGELVDVEKEIARLAKDLKNAEGEVARANGKLSNESPVGAALVGAHVGETVVAQTPGGALRIKVIEIAL